MNQINQNEQKIFITEKDIVIINLKDTDSALICTPYRCLSGVTINFLSLHEIKKRCLLDDSHELFNIINYTINENSSLTITSSLSTHGLDTVIYATEHGNRYMPTWKVVVQDNVLEK